MKPMRTLSGWRRLLVLAVGFWTVHAAAAPAWGGAGIARPLSIEVVYDNYTVTEGCEAEWGYACLVRARGMVVLFDTGGLPGIFFKNMASMDIDPMYIDAIVISHTHGDHIGGLFDLVEKKNGIPLYLPASANDHLVRALETRGSHVIRVDQPVAIVPGVYSTGEMRSAGGVAEQALYLRTVKRGVLVTGCAHPGVAVISDRARQHFKEPIHFVFGGFHLLEAPDEAIDAVIGGLREMDVTRLGPSHCTGGWAIERMRAAYGDNFAAMGVGTRISLED